MKARVRAPGSCGELVQGTISGNHFLITCPVDLYAEVTVEIGGQGGSAGEKTMAAVRKTWAFLGVDYDRVAVSALSALPRGKGMASSSADISAACQAAALCAGRTLTPDEIADIALGIEPSDGVFYPGIVMFDHIGGLIRKPLGDPPPLAVAIFDAGGEVDTLQFNRRDDLPGLNAAKEPAVREAVELVTRGLAAGDAALIGRGATLSALANQGILPKPCLSVMADLLPGLGAVGLNTAHSGTVIGVLFPADAAGRIAEAVATVKKHCPELTFIQTAKVISGGLTILGGDN